MARKEDLISPGGDDPSPAELIALRPWLYNHAVNGLLLDGLSLTAIANTVGTPTWVYSAATIRQRLGSLKEAMATTGLEVGIHYAAKANDAKAILALFSRDGIGVDVVSGGELLKARLASIPPSRIVYSGVGKSVAELELALTEDIGQINVESAEELEILSALAASQGRVARVALRINPDVDPGTNDKISTGRATDKFGIAYDDAVSLYARAELLPSIRPVGLAMHIGSQILSLAPYREAFARIVDLVSALREQGRRVEVVDCGGGLGIPYRNEPSPSPAELAAAIKHAFHGQGVRIGLEPGRWLVGPAGLLLASVVLVKNSSSNRFAVLDAAMNDLVRPAMYDAWHGIVPISAGDYNGTSVPYSVVGPVCETGDTFARERLLPPLNAGDRVAILDAGAYGAVMSSTYNSRPLAAEVWVDEGKWSIIRDRQRVKDQWRQERLPP
jgi:diaminopimelate decarboxylase